MLIIEDYELSHMNGKLFSTNYFQPISIMGWDWGMFNVLFF